MFCKQKQGPFVYKHGKISTLEDTSNLMDDDESGTIAAAAAEVAVPKPVFELRMEFSDYKEWVKHVHHFHIISALPGGACLFESCLGCIRRLVSCSGGSSYKPLPIFSRLEGWNTLNVSTFRTFILMLMKSMLLCNFASLDNLSYSSFEDIILDEGKNVGIIDHALRDSGKGPQSFESTDEFFDLMSSDSAYCNMSCLLAITVFCDIQIHVWVNGQDLPEIYGGKSTHYISLIKSDRISHYDGLTWKNASSHNFDANAASRTVRNEQDIREKAFQKKRALEQKAIRDETERQRVISIFLEKKRAIDAAAESATLSTQKSAAAEDTLTEAAVHTAAIFVSKKKNAQTKHVAADCTLPNALVPPVATTTTSPAVLANTACVNATPEASSAHDVLDAHAAHSNEAFSDANNAVPAAHTADSNAASADAVPAAHAADSNAASADAVPAAHAADSNAASADAVPAAHAADSNAASLPLHSAVLPEKSNLNDARDFTRYYELSGKLLIWRTEFDVRLFSETEGRGLVNLVPVIEGHPIHRYGGDRVYSCIGHNERSFVHKGANNPPKEQNGNIMYRPAQVLQLFKKYPQLDRTKTSGVKFHPTHAVQLGSQHPKHWKVTIRASALSRSLPDNICLGSGRYRRLSNV